MTTALAVLAMTYAGVMVWFHGVYVGMRDTHREVVNAQREVTAANLRVGQLRGQVAILEAGMLTGHDLDREWADLDRGGQA